MGRGSNKENNGEKEKVLQKKQARENHGIELNMVQGGWGVSNPRGIGENGGGR